MRLLLTIAAVVAFTGTVAQAEHGVDVKFRSEQYIFACKSLADMEYIIEGMKGGPDEVRERRNAKRLPASVGEAPSCDFLTSGGGKYTLFTALTDLMPVSLDESYGDGMLNTTTRMYAGSSTNGIPFFMLLFFPMETAPFENGYDMLTQVVGVE